MISYNDALQIIRQTALAKKLDTENVPLIDATNRICADTLVAPLDIQPFDNSAMDGFAVHMDDLLTACGTNPVQLNKSGTIAAGNDVKGISVEKGSCWHVMTGAPLPTGTQAIIPIENAIVNGDMITFTEKPVAGQHIRYAGEDFKKGAPLICPGDKITVSYILPLATLGVSNVTVFKKPRVLYIPTGTEIIDDLSVPLSGAKIYNSNKFYAVSFLTTCGAEVTVHDTIHDDLEHFAKALHEANNEHYDIVVSSGAVSAGTFDFVKEGLERSGAKTLYHKIKLKPGKPNLLASLPSGTPYFGLPGNPVATAVGLRFFIAEYLRLLKMQKPEQPLYARALNKFSKKSGLHMILKGQLQHDEDGSTGVTILDGQESFRVSPFLSMDCWVHIPEHQENIQSGDIVEIRPLIS